MDGREAPAASAHGRDDGPSVSVRPRRTFDGSRVRAVGGWFYDWSVTMWWIFFGVPALFVGLLLLLIVSVIVKNVVQIFKK